MNRIKISFLALAVLCGAFLVVFGGYDDSPGAQLLGLIIILVSVVVAMRMRKRHS